MLLARSECHSPEQGKDNEVINTALRRLQLQAWRGQLWCSRGSVEGVSVYQTAASVPLLYGIKERLVQLFTATLFDDAVIWGMAVPSLPPCWLLLAEQGSSWKGVWRAGPRPLVSPAKKSVVERHGRVRVIVVELLHGGRPVSMSAGTWELYLSHGTEQCPQVQSSVPDADALMPSGVYPRAGHCPSPAMVCSWRHSLGSAASLPCWCSSPLSPAHTGRLF